MTDAKFEVPEPVEVRDIPVFELDDTEQLVPLHSTVPFTELVESMRREGQLRPIKAMDADGPFTILDGFRRTRAARCLGWRSVTVELFPSMPTPAARLIALNSNLAEHQGTPDLVPMIRQALARGCSEAEVSQFLGGHDSESGPGPRER